jgi:hypothetical protein
MSFALSTQGTLFVFIIGFAGLASAVGGWLTESRRAGSVLAAAEGFLRRSPVLARDVRKGRAATPFSPSFDACGPSYAAKAGELRHTWRQSRLRPSFMAMRIGAFAHRVDARVGTPLPHVPVVRRWSIRDPAGESRTRHLRTLSAVAK